MSKSLEQIEALISRTARNAKTERELNVKGLNFGRWLNELGELEKASTWITKYLKIYDKDAKAHKLLGEIYEKMDRSDAALSCYKNSLRVQSRQYELMLKVAEMHINPGPTQNPNRAQVWLDKAALALPNDPQVYKLKMELYLAQEAPTSKLEDTIKQELKKRPTEPSLYVQYVTFLRDQDRLDEAFAYAQKTDGSSMFPKVVEKDLEWNQCLIDICQEYAEKMCDDDVTNEGLKAYSLLLISLCRIVWLYFEQEKYDEAMENLAMLDTSVFSALTLNHDLTGGYVQEWNAVLTEAKAQLCAITALALLRCACQNEISWVEANKMAAACFAVSLSYPVADVSETWASRSKDAVFGERLKIMGGFRLSQSGHMMRNLASTAHTEHSAEDRVNEHEWIADVKNNYCTEEGRQKVFNELFGENYNPETSMIYNDDKFMNVHVELIPEETLAEYDAIAAQGADLQTWVWMGLQWRQNYGNALNPFSWISSIFSELQLAPGTSVKHGNVWNLYQLDVESFVVSCVLYAEKAGVLWRRAKPDSDTNSLGLTRLPLPLCKKLTTEKQTSWWESACKLHYRKSREKIYNANSVKMILRHGIEAIRGSGNHGLQLKLMATLGKHFAAKAYAIDKSGMGTSSPAWLAYQRRAAHYWMLALPLLQDVLNNRVRHATEPKDKLFPNTLDNVTLTEARSMMSEVYMCNGGLLVQEGDLKKALETYGKADTPHASFCEALIYKQLVDNCDKMDTSLTASSNSKKRETYMRMYAAKLEVTLNRLRNEPDEELLRRTEQMLHEHVSTSPSFVRYREAEPKRLFEETIPKRSPHIGNHTVNSEVDDSVLPGPSKQSTPKSETRPEADYMERNDVAQLTKNLTTLTTALSTMQVNIIERLNKVEKSSPKAGEGDKEEQTEMKDKLEKIMSFMTGLQENKNDPLTPRERQMQLQIESLQEQLSRSQIGTPVAPGRVAQFTQQDGIAPQSPLQVFDRYQQAALGSPVHGPYYNVSAYPGYASPNPAAAAMYPAQGYVIPPGMPPSYGQPRMPQQVIDPRAIPTPVRTPPVHIRPEQTTSNSGLPMSKEAADALSVRFQAAMAGRDSPGVLTPPMGIASPGMVPGPRPPGSYSPMPLGPSLSQPIISEIPDQARIGLVRSDPGFGTQQAQPNPFSIGVATGPAKPSQSLYQPPSEPSPPQDLDGTYMPQAATNMTQQQGGTSVLRSLLSSGGQPSQTQSAQPEIHYPNRFNFPQKKDETGAPTWNFKFQTPEEMDNDNRKLEAAEEAEDAETSHNDTGPHFEPLVTLPEVEVVTGEEDEEAIFNERAKLFRWTDGQWKERGLGSMKILKHKQTGKYRLLMRREQVLKICCNHVIGKSLQLKPMPKSDRAWMWHAMDFSEEDGRQEGFAIRFKSPEIAKLFQEKFTEGQHANAKLSGETPPRPAPTSSLFTTQQKPIVTSPVTTKSAVIPAPTSASGSTKAKFSFPKPSGAAALNLAAKIAGSPTRQPETLKVNEPEEHEAEGDDVHHNTSGDGPHFEPIIPLPEKVEVKTGEEGEEVLFCQRAKLYRYADKQWKERGLGDIKILHNKETSKCRIVMRREQILKLCANHYITVDMNLAPFGNSDKLWTWAAMDHSDPDSPPQHEFLAVRFKTSEIAIEFNMNFNLAKEIIAGKASQTSATKPFSTSAAASASSSASQGPLVAKKDPGQWNCPGCYAPNPAKEMKCLCCAEPNPNAAQGVSSQPSVSSSQPNLKFSFGIPAGKSNTTYSFGITPAQSKTEPAEASGSKPSAFRFGANQGGFTFGKPSSENQEKNAESTNAGKNLFGGTQNKGPQIPATGPLIAIKDPGKWNCKDCYAENSASEDKCLCCGGANPNRPAKPKDDASTAKPGIFGFGATQKSVIFGIPKPSSTPQTSGTSVASTTNVTFGQSTGPLIAVKDPSKWSCKDCYAENSTSEDKCLCCGGANPNPQAKPKDDGNTAKPGIFSFGSTQKSTISFGIPKPSTTPQTSAVSTVAPTTKYSFGTGTYTIGSPFGGSGQQPGGVFSPNLGSNLSTPNSQQTGESPKPRFPSVGDEYEEESYDSDESDEESSEDDDDEYDEDYNREDYRYRSPLSRPTIQEERSSDDDVICLGEVLPSEELQKKAESLMLPKHFYNFLKNGESLDDDSGESGDTEEEKVKYHDNAEAKTLLSVTASNPAPTGSSFGFGALAVQGGSGFAFGNKTGGWIGMTDQKPLFASLKEHDTSQDGDEPYNPEADNVHFEPVVKLPEKVETVTGEEDEETLYSQRCKLYRFHKPTNEWKERGLGDIKILKHRGTGRIRIVMRREQVLKVCANHYIRPGMTLDPNKMSDKAWTWTALDHSDDGTEPKLEIFTARFKTPQIANEFKEKFDMCQMLLLDADPMTPCKASSLRTQELAQKAEKMKDELRYFKDKFSKPMKVDLENTLTDETTMSQNPAPPAGSLTPLVTQHAENLRKSSEMTTNGGISDTPQKPKNLVSGRNDFSFQMKSSDTQSKGAESRQHTVSTSSDDPQAEKEIHFEPIIQLPEKVDLVTGEENEQVIFANRAKLYAFHQESKQWKERGLGDVKILQDIKTFKVRVVMRREQVFKVCLNHHIQPEIKLSFKNPEIAKTVMWTAKDYSDTDKPDGEILQFAIRLKNSEIATSFKDLWAESANAAASSRLMEPDPSDINTSMVKQGATSPGPAAKTPQSPVSPVKPPPSTFSFANVPSPFQNAGASEGPVNVMGFVFGKPAEKSQTSTPSGKFTFDTSKLSFAFGTSTPQPGATATPSDIFQTPNQNFGNEKPGFSKTLFGGESESAMQSNLFVTASETLSDQTNISASTEDQKPKDSAQQSIFGSTTFQGLNIEREYRPSPLASDVGKSGHAYATQSGKFQFKPSASDNTPEESKDVPSQGSQSADDDDDDVIFVSELIPTADQRKRAEELLLPPTFFLYEDKLLPTGYNTEDEDDKEEAILRFIEDRDSGKLDIRKQNVIKPSESGDQVRDVASKVDDGSQSNGKLFGGGSVFGGGFGGLTSDTVAPSFGGGASFAALSSGVQNVGFKKDPSFQFPGAGQVMFQQQDEASGDDPTTFKCDAQFKPVLNEPPPLVEVKTGEEGEQVLFKERCKLFRFDTEAGAWKERGVGEIKILRNDEHKLHRVVMRRDQVFKVCTNHVITENTKPEYHLGAQKACSYFIMDYTEGKIPNPEQIAIKFKNEEICKAYMDKFYEIRTTEGFST